MELDPKTPEAEALNLNMPPPPPPIVVGASGQPLLAQSLSCWKLRGEFTLGVRWSVSWNSWF